MQVFVSYPFDSDIEKFTSEIILKLRKKTKYAIYFWKDDWSKSDNEKSFLEELENRIKNSDYFLFFWGNKIGETQELEIVCARELNKIIIPIKSPRYKKLTTLKEKYNLNKLDQYPSIYLKKNFKRDKQKMNDESSRVIGELITMLQSSAEVLKGLPKGYPFQYEKDIIQEYISGKGKLSNKFVQQGCPKEWPQVKMKKSNINNINPIPEDIIGRYRDWDGKKAKDPKVISAALSDYHSLNHDSCLLKLNLSFPEAGPRRFLYFPGKRARLKAGIVVSGGIAPGINSVISGIVKRHVLYYRQQAKKSINENEIELELLGYLEGFRSLLSEYEMPRTKILFNSSKAEESSDAWLKNRIYSKSTEGGSVVPTSRTPDLLTEYSDKFEDIIESLRSKHIDILYVIGGDGSMKAAHILSNYALKEKLDISIIGIPKTMDNDILWVWQSFGFPSSIEWAKGAIKQINTEVSSNPRLCIVQLFGSDSGFVATHAALASGVCDLVLIPEVRYRTEVAVNHVLKKLEKRYSAGDDGSSPYGIILLAETAIPVDAKETKILNNSALSKKEKEEIINYFKNGSRVKGQTPDELRSAGLKILTNSIKKALVGKYWKQFRVLTIEPKQLIRSVPPGTMDIIFGDRLGSLAVDGAMAGYHDFMISQWLTEFVMVPLDLVVLGRKRVQTNGMLWRSVIATTGQPYDLCCLENLSHYVRD